MPADSAPKFSVITPSFRQLDWLKLCAASVGDQEGVAFEHIIQDAGTGPELEEWVRANTRAQLIVEKDAGMYDAINRGLRRARGELCAYLNCDEQYLPGTLRRVTDFFERHPEIDVLFADAILTDPKLEPLSYRRVILPWRWHVLARPLGTLTCATFFRRKLVEEGALFDPAWRIIGDRAWVLDFLDRGYRMATLREPTSVFALTGGNLSNHPSVREEYARWEKIVPAVVRAAGPLVRAQYVVAKWREGAYEDRGVDSAWFTRESFPQRQPFVREKLSWHWPVLEEKA